MPLLLIELVVGGFALVIVLLTGFALWRRVKGLTATVRAASARVDEASAGLDAPRR